MKTVLIQTDFSTASENAFKRGLPILQNGEESIKVLLLNTFLVPSVHPDRSVAIHDELKKKSLDRLERELSRLKKSVISGKVSIEILSYMGSLENVMAYLTQERKIDYVLFGTSKNSKKEEIVKILNRASCPILIIPSAPNIAETMGKMDETIRS